MRLWVTILTTIVFSTICTATSFNQGGQQGLLRAKTAETLGKYRLSAGGGLQYSQDHSYVSGPNGTGSVVTTGGTAIDRDSPNIFSGNLFIGYGLASFFDVGMNMPLYYDNTGFGPARSGFGDLELSMKLSNPDLAVDAWWKTAYTFMIALPTGTERRGYFPRHAYYQTASNREPGESPFTASSVLFSPGINFTLNFQMLNRAVPLSLHAGLAAIVTPVKSASALSGSIALEYRPIPLLTAFLEFSGEARIKYYTEHFSLSAFDNDPLWLTPGVKFNLPHQFYVIGAADLGIVDDRPEIRSTWNRSGYRYSTAPTPVYNAQIKFGWSGYIKDDDDDGDKIFNREDACPYRAEDYDGFEDEDGCPDLDNDNDGLLDIKDNCPMQAATCDGCPVVDQDGDSIFDDVDQCINNPEDMDGFEDSDGCPDIDNDKDGVLDEQDACPLEPEDKDGFQDEDGCPDLDNDGDGVADAQDKCPMVRGLVENDGCPKTKEIRGKLTLTGVNFSSGSANLTQNSFKILDKVLESLKEWPEVRVEIRGYTDSRGSEITNLNISQKRAEAVRVYLISNGIDPQRVRAVGLGEADPVAPNTTAAGRAENRRVEMVRIN